MWGEQCLSRAPARLSEHMQRYAAELMTSRLVVYLALLVHVVSVATTWRLIRIYRYRPSETSAYELTWLQQVPRKLRRESCDSTRLTVLANGQFHWLLWVLYVLASIHVEFGLVVMASLLFMSTQGTAIVVARYVGCTLMCRGVAEVETREPRRLRRSPGREGEPGDCDHIYEAQNVYPELHEP